MRIWTDIDGAGEPQQFTVRPAGIVGVTLELPGDARAGSRLCLIRAFVGETQIAAAVQTIAWRLAVVTNTLALGLLVKGKVSIDGRPPAGGQVEVLAASEPGQAPALLGASPPAAGDGRFLVTCTLPSEAARPAAITLRYGFDPVSGSARLSRLIEAPAPEIEVDLVGSQTVPPGPPGPEGFVIRGGLAYVSREGLGEKIELRVVVNSLGGRTVIATQNVTSADSYEIVLAAPQASGGLVVEAHMPDANGRRSTRLGVSATATSPVSPVQLDLLIGDPAATLPLFESLLARAAPHLDGLPFGSLSGEQWTFLSSAARFSADETARLRRAVDLSRQFGERTGDDPARVLPALFGLVAEPRNYALPSLLAAGDQAQHAALALAQEAGDMGAGPWSIPGFRDPVGLVEFFKLKNGAAGQKILFDAGAPDAPVSARLAAIGVSGNAKRRHVMALLEAHADPDDLREAVLASPSLSDAEKARTISVQATAALAEFQAPLVEALAAARARVRLTEPSSVAAYQADELAAVIRAVGAVPPKHAAAADPAAAFAEAILDRCFARYPTSSLVARMAAAPKLPETAQLAIQVLRDHPEFDLYATPVADHFAPAGSAGERDPERVPIDRDRFDALQMTQRLGRLTPRRMAPDAVTGLMQMGIDSASAVIATGELRFTDAAMANGWDQALMNATYNGAMVIHQVTEMISCTLGEVGYELSAEGILNVRTDSVPQLAELFGSFDSCACTECRSVYSPAAYLTDLLRWLEQEFVHTGGSSGYAKLMERRGDIAHLKLTCDNSHTLMPLIDIVLEIFEYVASQQTLDLSAAAHQTDWQTPMLLRDGEHFGATEKPAYGPGRLLDSVYPWNLPFNLWLEQMRVYLDVMGVKRSDLVALGAGVAPWQADRDVAAETLGLNDLQFDIIAGLHIPAGGTAAYWNGMSVGGKPVSDVLRISGLGYEELLEILKTEYVRRAKGPTVTFSIVFDPRSPCDLSQAQISPPLAAAYADHIYRLAQLRQALGWSFWEVDEAILALATTSPGVDPLDAALLEHLAGLNSLAAQTRRPIPELIAWFGDFPAYRGEAPSEFYIAEFLDKAGPGQGAGLFALAPAPDIANRQLAAPRPLNSALANGLGPGELDQLRDTLGMDPDDFAFTMTWFMAVNLDLAMLTAMYRFGAIARAAGTSVRELIFISGLGPIQGAWTPHAAIRFLEFVHWLSGSGLTGDMLNYLLSGAGEGGGLAIGADDVTAVKARLYGIDGRFHALLSDPPVPAPASPDSQADRVEQLFTAVVESLQLDDGGALLRAVVARDSAKFPLTQPSNSSQAFDPGDYVDLLFPNQPVAAPWGFALADALQRSDHPRAAGSPPVLGTDDWRTELEVKAAIATLRAPVMLGIALREAALAAYSDLLQVPQDRAAFLLDTVRSNLAGANATLGDILIPAANLLYNPANPIAPPSAVDPLIGELHLVAERLRRLGLLDAPLAGLESLAAETSPGVAAGATGRAWFDLFWSGPPLTMLDEATTRWRNLEEALSLQAILGVSLENLIKGLSLVQSTPNAPANGQALMLLPGSRLAGRGAGEIGDVLSHLDGRGFGDSASLLVAQSARIFDSLTRWRLSFAQALRFAAYPVNADLPEDARTSLRSRYPVEAKWDKIICEANDGLRLRRRDALLGFLAARHGLQDEVGIYGHFLIDVEMSTCMTTTRIALAIATVQQFIQRIFLGLEPGIRFGPSQIEKWDWMGKLAVWGAAREAFLYTEDFLEASLRLDKTPCFTALEEELQQGEPTEERLEAAYISYVEKVADVSRLDIRGFAYNSIEALVASPDADFLQVIGRTRTQPHRYFHRGQKWNGNWGPWLPVERDLDGDHLMMAYWNRRLHVITPTFVERKRGDEPYYEIMFNHVSLRGDQWTPKRKLPGRILSGRFCGPGLIDDLDRKTGNLKPHSPLYGLTLGEDTTEQVITQYQYIGPFHIHGPVNALDRFLSPPIIVTSMADVPNLFTNDYPWVQAKVHDPDNWIPIYGTGPVADAVQDFAPASMRPDSYVFRAWPDSATGGNLHIFVRREFADEWETYHRGYVELAYEDGLRLTSDGRVTIRPEVAPSTTAWWGKYLFSTPYWTRPEAMKLRNGFDQAVEMKTSPQDAGKLYAKHSPGHLDWSPGPLVVLDTTPAGYEIIFEQANGHHLFPEAFFFEDAEHSYFAATNWFDVSGYRFTNFTIAGTQLYLAQLNADGVRGLLAPRPSYQGSPINDLKRQQAVFDADFQNRYAPTSLVRTPYPVEDMDFTHGSPTSIYFWEMFFHVPMRVVETLREAGQYERALQWLGYIFDPTNQDDPADPSRYWNIAPFHAHQSRGTIQSLMTLLSTASTPAEIAERDSLKAQIAVWLEDPFNPHAVAALRTSAYMLWVFTRYVEILIDWGDRQFRTRTRESIAEATQLYMFARNLMGRRWTEVEKADAAPKSYDEIRASLDAFSNAAVTVENNLTVYDLVPGAVHASPINHLAAQALYFCIPRNPRLVALYDVIDDRLGKIHSCLTIDGAANVMPLYEERLDPDLLVRARAAGLDIGDVVANLAAPRAPYRYSHLAGLAQQFAGEVKSFGAALLSAIEKRDGERLGQLQKEQEKSVQQGMRNVRLRQRDQSRAQVDAIDQNRRMVEARQAAYAARKPMIDEESKQLALLQQSATFASVQSVLSGVASVMHLLDMHIGSPVATIKSIRLGNVVGAAAGVMGSLASARSLSSTMAGLNAGAKRRAEDFLFQVNSAGEELKHIEKQRLTLEIGVAISEIELENLDRQIEQSDEVLDFMKFKFANDKLHSWMASRLTSLHHQAYGLAYDMAQKAQAAFADELGRPDADFIRFGDWESPKHGLLAGESLGLQLRQMEAAYVEGHERGYEISRTFSLALLEPAALAELMAGGACEFALPEWLYDLDCPGHYDRRIASVALTLPCVVGPQVPVHAKLTLLSHRIRRTPDLSVTPETRYDAVQSIVTSSGLNDSGLFDPNLQDARYLPFEGSGAVARFRLELPGDPQFDRTTISDAILTVRYRARDGGDLFRAEVEDVQAAVAPRMMMSYRHDFGPEWRLFLSGGQAQHSAVAAAIADAIANQTAAPAPAPVFPLAAPSIPPEREPYRARTVAGTFKPVQAWAVTEDGNGSRTLVGIDLAGIPLENGVDYVGGEPFFGADGLKWLEDGTDRRDVVDIVLIYEKS